MNANRTKLTRRTFVAGASTVAAGALAGAVASASAAEAPAPEDSQAPAGAGADAVQVARTEEYDVVVVGAGSAGLAAAAAAAEEGARVACLEKLPASMGAGTYYGFINTDLLTANGVEPVDEGTYARALYAASLGAGDPALINAFVAHSAAAGNWLDGIAEQTGNKAMFSMDMGSEKTAYYDGDDSSAYGALVDYGEGLGADYVYSCPAVALDRNETGRVTGVVAHDLNADEYVRYTAAAGVVLACGGFSASAELMERYIPWVDVAATVNYSPVALSPDPDGNGNMGDAITMAQAVGACVPQAPLCPMIHFIQGAMPMAGSLFVNGAGRRFMDEGTSMEVAAQTVMRQPGHAMFQIADAKPSGMALVMMQAAAAAGEGAPAEGGAPAGGEGEAPAGPGGPMAGMMGGDGPSYDTLEELAEANGFDPEVLVATVARWNELVAAGVDEDFGSDFSMAVSIDTPPYTCTQAGSCLLAAMGGPQIDAGMHVLDESLAPIPGLYAAGNCAGGFYGPNYPMQVQSGLARAFCTVSGYLAAKDALGQ